MGASRRGGHLTERLVPAQVQRRGPRFQRAARSCGLCGSACAAGPRRRRRVQVAASSSWAVSVLAGAEGRATDVAKGRRWAWLMTWLSTGWGSFGSTTPHSSQVPLQTIGTKLGPQSRKRAVRIGEGEGTSVSEMPIKWDFQAGWDGSGQLNLCVSKPVP